MYGSAIQDLGHRLDYYCQHGCKTEQPPHQDHQVEAHQAVIEDLASMTKPEDFWSLMVMATGSGKSFTAGKEIKAFNTPVGAQNPVWDKPALIVTSRIMLTNQFKRDLAQKTGIPESAIGVYSSQSKAKSQLEKPVLIMPYPTFRNMSKAGRITPEDRPLLVLDEAHNAIGFEAMREIKKNWVGKSYIQCWTATDKLQKKTVAQVLFDTKTSKEEDDATYRLTLKQAAERGISAPLKSMVLETEFSSGAKPTASGNLRAEDEEKIVNQKGRMEALIRLCHGDYTDKFGVDFCGLKTIVFSPGVAHGKKLAEEFNKVFGPGYAVAVNGEETPHTELDPSSTGTLAWRFTRGDRAQHDPVILITDKLIEEGADLPSAELAVEEVPTFSEKVETQRVGRVVRKLNGKAAYSVVMMDKDQEGAAIIGEMEGWELKPAGFEFPKPATKRDKPDPPPLPPDYPDIKVNIIADAKEIAEFKDRRNAAYQIKTPEWLSFTDVRKQLDTSPEMIRPFWEKIVAAANLDDTKEQALNIENVQIPFSYRRVESNSHIVPCINQSCLEALRSHLPIGEKDLEKEKWLGRIEFFRKTGTTEKNQKAETLWQRILDAYVASPKQPVSIDGHIVKCAKIARGGQQTSSGGVFCVHLEEIGWFQKQIGIFEKKVANVWLNQKETAKEIGTSKNTPRFKVGWEELESTYQQTLVSPVILNGNSIECGYKASGPKIPFCIHINSAPAFHNYLISLEGDMKPLQGKRKAKPSEMGAVASIADLDTQQATTPPPPTGDIIPSEKVKTTETHKHNPVPEIKA